MLVSGVVNCNGIDIYEMKDVVFGVVLMLPIIFLRLFPFFF